MKSLTNKVCDQISEKINLNIINQGYNPVRVQVRDQVLNQVRVQVFDQVWYLVMDQVLEDMLCQIGLRILGKINKDIK